jgi:hypothetical protein
VVWPLWRAHMRPVFALLGVLLVWACAPTGVSSVTPTSPPSSASATATPLPADALDLNCDERYERLIKTFDTVTPRPSPPLIALAIEALDTGQRVMVHDTQRADIATIEDPIALRLGSGCEQLIVVPVRFAGSGSILQLMIFRWNWAGVIKVFDETVQHGRWSAEGNSLTLSGPVYLYNEPNCCPCTFQDRVYAWDGQRLPSERQAQAGRSHCRHRRCGAPVHAAKAVVAQAQTRAGGTTVGQAFQPSCPQTRHAPDYRQAHRRVRRAATSGACCCP